MKTRILVVIAAILASLLVVSCRKRGETIGSMRFPEPSRPSDATPAPPVAGSITDLSSPESVLWDPQQDVYFISNMNGGLVSRDNNGFISRVDPNTLQTNFKWIAGGVNGVTLHAPKGMTVLGDTLYVSDVEGVRLFDRRTGAAKGLIPLPPAIFVNDLVNDGKHVFASDSGILPEAGSDFARSNTDAIWEIDGTSAKKIASGKDLEEPNGLDIVDGKLYFVTFGAADLCTLDGGKKQIVTTLPTGQLDGIVHLPNGDFVITSWKGDAIYRGPARGPFQKVLSGINSPADIGYDTKRNRLLVPHPNANSVTIHILK